jgi:hypothetical protein
MKYTIYRELYKLTKLYPFTPEQIGFTPVNRESAIPFDTSSFTWDEDKDELFDTEGKPIEKKPKIHSHNWDCVLGMKIRMNYSTQKGSRSRRSQKSIVTTGIVYH